MGSSMSTCYLLYCQCTAARYLGVWLDSDTNWLLEQGLTGCWRLREDDLRLDPGPLRAGCPPGGQPGRTRMVNMVALGGPRQRPLALHSLTQLRHDWHDHLNSVITGMVTGSEPGAPRRPAGARAAATGQAFSE